MTIRSLLTGLVAGVLMLSTTGIAAAHPHAETTVDAGLVAAQPVAQSLVADLSDLSIAGAASVTASMQDDDEELMAALDELEAALDELMDALEELEAALDD